MNQSPLLGQILTFTDTYLNCWTVQKFIFKEKLLRSSASLLCTLVGSVLLGIDIKCIKFKVSLEYGMVEPYGFVPKCHTWVFHFCMKIWLDIMGQLIWFCLLSDLLSLMSRTKYHQPSYFLNHLFVKSLVLDYKEISYIFNICWYQTNPDELSQCQYTSKGPRKHKHTHPVSAEWSDQGIWPELKKLSELFSLSDHRSNFTLVNFGVVIFWTHFHNYNCLSI